MFAPDMDRPWKRQLRLCMSLHLHLNVDVAVDVNANVDSDGDGDVDCFVDDMMVLNCRIAY